ncbi:unnamed protein product [Ostreobium quekettii]|uniref:Uncharacterized protein n=1 Tax=Ostreobium quekettii TaxID=121088 RepID=A0A8S1J2V8_9CHLO|nr:unnamed protein product [Ostreobium quekettii]
MLSRKLIAVKGNHVVPFVLPPGLGVRETFLHAMKGDVEVSECKRKGHNTMACVIRKHVLRAELRMWQSFSASMFCLTAIYVSSTDSHTGWPTGLLCSMDSNCIQGCLEWAMVCVRKISGTALWPGACAALQQPHCLSNKLMLM